MTVFLARIEHYFMTVTPKQLSVIAVIIALLTVVTGILGGGFLWALSINKEMGRFEQAVPQIQADITKINNTADSTNKDIKEINKEITEIRIMLATSAAKKK